jgi:hypothetical protein
MAADLSNLSKSIYDGQFLSRIYSIPKCAVEELIGNDGRKECRIEYGTMEEFTKIAQQIGIMADTKGGGGDSFSFRYIDKF